MQNVCVSSVSGNTLKKQSLSELLLAGRLLKSISLHKPFQLHLSKEEKKKEEKSKTPLHLTKLLRADFHCTSYNHE